MQMKTIITVTFLFMLLQLACGQNIVPNPSFEIYDTCPNNIGQINRSIGWYSCNATPEYFNSCAIPGTYSVPNNFFGFQLAADGNAYAGLYTYVYYATDAREYIGRELSLPLTIGVKYFLSFKVVLCNQANCGTNKIGVLFLTVPHIDYNPYDTLYLHPNNFANIYSDSIIIDTLNWTIISGSFIADSNYQYIAIGNFYQDTQTQYITTDSSIYCMNYYFIDNICISIDSLTCLQPNFIEENININEFKIYPNPVTNQLYIEFYKSFNKPVILFIYDTYGRLTRRVDNIINSFNIDVSNYPQGIYYLQIQNEKILFSKIIIIN